MILTKSRANFFDLRYIRDTTSPYPYMVPNDATFSAFLKTHGVKPATSTVVVYDQKTDTQPYWATRAYWMFLAFGIKNVRVLSGGLPLWEK